MGSPVITKKGFAAALNNCAFISTRDLKYDRVYPFLFLMDASMLGVGVGFDTVGAETFIVSSPNTKVKNHAITDDREGWVESVRLLLNAYFYNDDDVNFDYSKIRELGKKLKTFGGTSSGPGPLITLHKNIRKVLDNEIGKPISVTCITDIMNMIGVCTVSGNIRRCLPKNSLVHTNKGLIAIQNINIGDYVQTTDGFDIVSDVMEQGQQNIVKLITSDGYFRCTVNHKMAVLNRNDTYKWVSAKDLRPGCKLITNRVPITEGNKFTEVQEAFVRYTGMLSSYNTIIPPYILIASIDHKLTYLSGIIDANFSGPDVITTGPIEWLHEIQNICYSCGFETSIQGNKLITHTEYSRYVVSNIPGLVKKFDNSYNPELTSKYYYTEFIELEYETELVETYDITVENKHEFFCNGYLTHNSAEIAFGQADCKEFLNLKNYEVNPQRIEHGWSSNNSIFANIGMNYDEVCEHVRTNGEPGFAWLQNMKSYSRMNGKPDNKDIRVSGGNPCLEQSLESMELCCLVETFPTKHSSLDDFKDTLKSAFLFAKIVTLLPLHWQKSNEIMMRNRRIGCSVSGIAQFITEHGLNELKNWLETGYNTLKEIDKEISEWLCIRQSIKMTSVKPSGTVSLLAGATPGIHYPESKYYIRRIRIARDSYLLERLIKAGYHVEPCTMSSDTTVVVEFPVCAGSSIRTTREVSMWEQLSLASFMQRYWADNQVSATITFDPETEGHHIANALNYFQYQLKGISFLPRLTDNSIYKQIPYEGITKEQYDVIYSKINKNVSLSTGVESTATDESQMTYCDNDRCIKI